MSANFVDVMLIDADTIVLPAHDLPRTGARRSPLAAGVVLPLLALFWWLDPLRVRLRMAALGAVVCLAALERTVVRGADGPREGVRVGRLRVAVRPLRRARALRSSRRAAHASRTAPFAIACRRPRPRPASRAQRLPHIILVLDESSFDISTVAGVKVPPGYQSHFRSFDGKERTLPGRRRGRADLVHRVQRAERPFGALVRPLRRVRDADRRRPRHAKPAERAAQLRLSHLQRLSLARRLSQRAQFPEDARHRSLLRRQGSQDRATSSRTSSITPSPPICCSATTRKAPMFVFTYLMANHFPWTFRYRDELSAGLARSRQPRRRTATASTNICAGRT